MITMTPFEHPRMQDFRQCLARVALLGLAALPAYGQQQSVPGVTALGGEVGEIPQYTVELIVFEYVGSAASTTEIFTPEASAADEVPVDDTALAPTSTPPGARNDPPSEPDVAPVNAASRPVAPDSPDEDLELIPTSEAAGLQMVDPADYQLTNAWRKLASLDAYRPLLHTAWTQPTLEKERTPPLNLRRIGNPPLRLDGTVSLYLSRYLHLVIDLSLEEKAPQRMTATEERVRAYDDSRRPDPFGMGSAFITPPVYYRIEEDRIVRNNELRYFDHPKFGVLAKITKVEADEPEVTDTTGDLLPGNSN